MGQGKRSILGENVSISELIKDDAAGSQDIDSYLNALTHEAQGAEYKASEGALP